MNKQDKSKTCRNCKQNVFSTCTIKTGLHYIQPKLYAKMPNSKINLDSTCQEYKPKL